MENQDLWKNGQKGEEKKRGNRFAKWENWVKFNSERQRCERLFWNEVVAKHLFCYFRYLTFWYA